MSLQNKMMQNVYLQHIVNGRSLITKPLCKLFWKVLLREAKNCTENLRILVYRKITFL